MRREILWRIGAFEKSFDWLLLTFKLRLDVNPPKCRNPEVMKSRNANIRHT